MTPDLHTASRPEGLSARPLQGGWFDARGAGVYVLARHWPPRFDVAASSPFPPARRGRLARQIRQDMWRAFKHLRGFSPVVQVDATETGLTVTAGGRMMTRQPLEPNLVGDIQALLDSPVHRTRWLNWAQERKG